MKKVLIILFIILISFVNIYAMDVDDIYVFDNTNYHELDIGNEFNLITLNNNKVRLNDYVSNINNILTDSVNSGKVLGYGSIDIYSNELLVDCIDYNIEFIINKSKLDYININVLNNTYKYIVTNTINGDSLIDFNDYYYNPIYYINNYNIEAINCNKLKYYDYFIDNLYNLNLVFLYGIYYYNDSDVNLYLNEGNNFNIDEIISLVKINTKDLNNTLYYNILYNDLDNEIGKYKIKLIALDNNDNFIFKNINIEIINLNNLINIKDINIGNTKCLTDDEIFNLCVDTNLNIKYYKLKNLYKYYSHLYGEYNSVILLIDELNNYYIDDFNINIKDLDGPIIKPKYEGFKNLYIDNKHYIELDYIKDLFYIYDLSSEVDVKIEGYDEYYNNYNICNEYKINVVAKDKYENKREYDFNINVIDKEGKYINMDYYINIYLSNRLSMDEIYNVLIEKGDIDNNYELISDYFNSNDGGVYDLYAKSDNLVLGYKINVINDIKNEKNKNNKNNNHVYIIISSISILTIILIIMGRIIYEKKH